MGSDVPEGSHVVAMSEEEYQAWQDWKAIAPDKHEVIRGVLSYHGHLTDEQEEKLRNLWRAIYR